MELKLNLRVRGRLSSVRSNRTFMELKYNTAGRIITSIDSSNRTFMELKSLSSCRG